MTEIGIPDAVPEIEIQPLYDPVPRVKPHEVPREPTIIPKPVPKREREPVPA